LKKYVPPRPASAASGSWQARRPCVTDRMSLRTPVRVCTVPTTCGGDAKKLRAHEFAGMRPGCIRKTLGTKTEETVNEHIRFAAGNPAGKHGEYQLERCFSSLDRHCTTCSGDTVELKCGKLWQATQVLGTSTQATMPQRAAQRQQSRAPELPHLHAMLFQDGRRVDGGH
jgi:hypothetical protein